MELLLCVLMHKKTRCFAFDDCEDRETSGFSSLTVFGESSDQATVRTFRCQARPQRRRRRDATSTASVSR